MHELRQLLLAWNISNARNTDAIRHAIHDKLIELGMPKVAYQHYVLQPLCTPVSCCLTCFATLSESLDVFAARMREEESFTQLPLPSHGRT